MKAVNIHEAKTRLSSLLAEVQSAGVTFVICRNGTPVADLVPHRKVDRKHPHTVMSKIAINYDTTEPLDQEEWPEEAR